MKLRALHLSALPQLFAGCFYALLPTPATLLFNYRRVRKPMRAPSLPLAEWSRRERHRLLIGSEERRRNLEGKGPGLATVSAVVVAAALVGITGGWKESDAVAKALLALAASYAGLSLLMPIYLVGPLKRNIIDARELEAAADMTDAEEALAQSAAEAAMINDLSNVQLSNLLEAARRELVYAFALLLLWVLLVPATALLQNQPTTAILPGQVQQLRPSTPHS